MHSPRPSDYELLDAWKRGDAASGEALFERHFDSLQRFFSGKVCQGAHDLVQETLLSCLEAASGFHGHASFRTLLFSMARQRLLDRLRAERLERAHLETRDMCVESRASSRSQVTLRVQDHDLLLGALRSLPLDTQIALELTCWEGLSDSEVARVVGLSVDTVHMHIRRAKDRLREGLARMSASGSTDEISDADLQRWAHAVRDERVRDRRRASEA